MVNTSVILVSFNQRPQLEGLLGNLHLEQATNTEVIVVDNDSSDDSAAAAESCAGVRVIRQGANVGFGAAVRSAWDKALGEMIVVAHADIFTDIHVLTELADRCRLGRARRIAACAPLLMGTDQRPQASVGNFPGLWQGMLGKVRKLGEPTLDHLPDHQWMLGACLALNGEIIQEMGGYDASFFLDGTDMDLGRRLHDRSWRISIARDLPVLHRGAGRGAPMDDNFVSLLRRDQARFIAKHRAGWQAKLLRA